MVLSRSSRNFGLDGARGPSCSVANFKAGAISPSEALQDRMSSRSCRRKREKCSALSSSKIYAVMSEIEFLTQ